MIALKPVLSAWLDEAEAAKRDPDSLGGGVLPPGEKKRKRTSIAAPEKRSLEAYFAVQPRPSGEKASRVELEYYNGWRISSATSCLAVLLVCSLSSPHTPYGASFLRAP